MGKWQVWSLAGALISCILLTAVLWRLDWAEFWKALSDLDPFGVCASMVCMTGAIALRALRWQYASGVGAYGTVWTATSAGYLGNLAYPARAGEIIRIALLCRLSGISPAAAATSAVADRSLDIVVMICATFIVLAQYAGGSGLETVQAVLPALMVPLALFALVILFSERLRALLLLHRARFSRKWWQRVATAVEQMLESLSRLRAPRRLASVFLLSAGAAIVDYLSVWAIIHALGLEVPLAAVVAVSVLLAIGSLLPAAPGYIGVYQVAAVLALTPFGVSVAGAVAFSVVLQLIAVAVVLLHGVAIAARFGRSVCAMPRQ
jgi:uncharacterized protein (TIRG00374 family)